MGLIVKKLEISGEKGKLVTEVLFDTGARNSVIRKDIAEKVATIVKFEPKTFGLATIGTNVTSREGVIIDILIDGKHIDGEFYVIEGLRRDIIVGADFMQKWSIILYPEKEEIFVNADPQNIELF